MVDYTMEPGDFAAHLTTMDGTVLALPETALAVTTAGDALATALRDSDCAPAVRSVIHDVLREDLLNVTIACENVVGAGHGVHEALSTGDHTMAEDATKKAVP